MDTDGAIWTGTGDTRLSTGRVDSPGGAVARVREGGEELNRVEHDRSILGSAAWGLRPQNSFPRSDGMARHESVGRDSCSRAPDRCSPFRPPLQGPDGHSRSRQAAHDHSRKGCGAKGLTNSGFSGPPSLSPPCQRASPDDGHRRLGGRRASYRRWAERCRPRSARQRPDELRPSRMHWTTLASILAVTILPA